MALFGWAKSLIGAAREFTIALAVLFALSLLAPFWFYFELLSHFTFQYFLLGLALSAFWLIQRKIRPALLTLAITLACFSAMRLPMNEPLRFLSPTIDGPHINLLQFNVQINNGDQTRVIEWIRKHALDHDVLLFYEASPALSESLETLRSDFPYQIHEPRKHAFGMVILSKHEVTNSEITSLYSNFVASFDIRPKNFALPIRIFSLHAIPPGMGRTATRDYEITESAKLISKTKDKHIIFAGDWNITPYAPVFRDILQISGLIYQVPGLQQQPSWPTFAPSFAKIPIDHTLFSASLSPTQRVIHRGTAWSDHNAITTRFTER
ncbi:endonuclease/exonuclease/phosphatase family protein [Micavibrio aeruginosavorus]|uniref:Endonuclease/Exonuclease/phosphatase family protein n=1 Tax=Micavibrio aeruginosavorus (strain ARL-13) TaxID=856793 RepID=G2KQE4_MICAA|nr:endonuclease/exonuclease/phosphatase family protein [Micavibrio aeruginosavorus]AEP09080.1 endonuclease/Exonuclease/phosphatase family protein [Micavibrio aeruginosavorus ARL-13]